MDDGKHHSRNYTIPSKTFLLGEYVALNGGPALVFASQPCFSLSLTESGAQNNCPFHPQSPAGRYYQQHCKDFSGMEIGFDDPHQGRGGLGASSAQFLGLYQYHRQRLEPDWHFSSADVPELLNAYRQCAWSGQGLAPSGYDVIAQACSGLCFIDKQGEVLHSHPWPFEDLDLCLVRTGKKLATHEHLHQMKDIDTSQLATLVYQAENALKSADSASFTQAVSDYGRQLAEASLCAPHTQEMLGILQAHPACLTAKGCGAMGADIIFCLSHNNASASLRQWLQQQSWDVLL